MRRTPLGSSVSMFFLAWALVEPVSAELLDPTDFPSLGVLDTTVGGSYTIDTDALTITNDAAPGVPLFVGVINAQDGLADSYGPGGAVTTVGPAGIPHIAVFTFDDVQLGAASSFTVVGHRALALLSRGNAVVDTAITLLPQLGTTLVVPDTTTSAVLPGLSSGPGGFAGGSSLGVGVTPAPGQGFGGAGSTFVQFWIGNGLRGGSAGHGNVGLAGICDGICPGVVIGAGGAKTAEALDVVLRGGSGGGAAHHNPNANEFTAGGQGGGGALEIGAAGLLTLGTASLLDVSADGTRDNLVRMVSPFHLIIAGHGSSGGLRVHAARLVNLGSNNLRAPGPGLGSGGTILMRGVDSALVIGQSSLAPGQFGANPGNGVFSLGVARLVVLSGETFELSGESVWQAQTATEPQIEISVGDIELQDAATGTVPVAGFTNRSEIRLGGPSASVTGSALLTNEGVVRGSGTIAVPFVNAATGRVDVSHEELAFAQGFSNAAGGSINVLVGTLGVPGDGAPNDDGLVNFGSLNLIDAVIDGDVRSPAGSEIKVAGVVDFNGLVSGGATFSGTQNLVVFNGGYSPGDSPAQIAFEGDVTFGPQGTLTLELGGPVPGADHDRLDVAGQVGLAGSVDLLLVDDFAPAFGTSLTLLTYAARAGEFGGVSGVAQAGELDLAVRYDTGALVVSAVRRGDVNGDGLLTAADTAIVEAGAVAALATTAYAAGDVDGSGLVDAADVSIVEAAVAAAAGAAVPMLGPLAMAFLVLAMIAVATLPRGSVPAH